MDAQQRIIELETALEEIMWSTSNEQVFNIAAAVLSWSDRTDLEAAGLDD